MPTFIDHDKFRTRQSFSFAPLVKKLYPGAEAREDLSMVFAPYYLDALFATPEDPVVVEHDFYTFILYPTTRDPKKIRVVLPL